MTGNRLDILLDCTRCDEYRGWHRADGDGKGDPVYCDNCGKKHSENSLVAV